MTDSGKLWGGRFQGEIDQAMKKFNDSIPYDKRLWRADIIGSKAYARALQLRNIITEDERDKMIKGLDEVAEEWKDGSFKIQSSDEDIHTANERRLSEKIDAAIGGKLHTGRSRNDQVATDLRIWTRDEIDQQLKLLCGLVEELANRAEKEIDVLIPGYTHLQRAQPIRWSHLLLSYATFLISDIERFMQLRQRTNQLPLGSGALAGNPFNIDREFLRQELEFDSIIQNSLAAVSDRDFVTEFLFAASLSMVHLSRFAEDLIVYSSAEFSFITIADEFSSGSSLMPQKKNADSLELIRGKCGRAFGNLAGFMMTVKGLPSTYNKDLQEDKEALFETADTLASALKIGTGVLSTLRINSKRMQSALSMDMLATDLADYAVRSGVPFRRAHYLSGRAVKLAEERGLSGIDQLSKSDFTAIDPVFAEMTVDGVFDFEKSVECRESLGGTSRSAVQQQIKMIRQKLHKIENPSKN